MQTLINSLKEKTSNVAWETWYSNSIKHGNIAEFPVLQSSFTSSSFLKVVFGATTFIVNNKIFWGQDRLEYALDEIKKN